jgi:anti-sigma28 factor (negative regulator of flagellin synthesis)
VSLDEIDGQNSDMIIQKQIVTAGQLLDKVEKLKDKIDNGDLDG